MGPTSGLPHRSRCISRRSASCLITGTGVRILWFSVCPSYRFKWRVQRAERRSGNTPFKSLEFTFAQPCEACHGKTGGCRFGQDGENRLDFFKGIGIRFGWWSRVRADGSILHGIKNPRMKVYEGMRKIIDELFLMIFMIMLLEETDTYEVSLVDCALPGRWIYFRPLHHRNEQPRSG